VSVHANPYQTAAIQEAIQQFDANVTRIADLHSRALNALDETATQANTAQLNSLSDETRQLSNGLANRIQSLERPSGAGQDAQIRKNRVCCTCTLHEAAPYMIARLILSAQNLWLRCSGTRMLSASTVSSTVNVLSGNSK
jgi:hypothetical protein